MDDKPLISVIIPSYNRGHLIQKAAQSVLEQTYKNIELIIVDDGSTDNTESQVKSIADSRIKYFKLEKNTGACAARNKGIQEANGEYISFNDSDDCWKNEKLETQLEFLKQENADVVLCAMRCYDENGNFLHDFPKNVETGKISYEQLLKYNCSSTQILFGKAECFKNTLFDASMPRLQDWDITLRLSQKYNLFFQNKILADTFIQKDSISTHPEKGIAAMEKLFIKHQQAICTNKNITESFFSKKSAYVCLSGKNPVDEMRAIYRANKTLPNLLKFVLSKIGLYTLVFKIKMGMPIFF